jgi:hypothetical protein
LEIPEASQRVREKATRDAVNRARAVATNALGDWFGRRGVQQRRRNLADDRGQPSMRSTHTIDQQIVATVLKYEASPANVATGGRT